MAKPGKSQAINLYFPSLLALHSDQNWNLLFLALEARVANDLHLLCTFMFHFKNH